MASGRKRRALPVFEIGESSSSVGPRVRRRRGAFPVDGNIAESDALGRPLPSYVDCGDCSGICPFCGAFYWRSECVGNSSRYTRCCKSGSVVLPGPFSPPLPLLLLFRDRDFRENIRAYNMMFAMTSFGATVDTKINDGSGPYVFKVNGQISHRLGCFFPNSGEVPRFLQLYIHDSANEIANRMFPFRKEGRSDLSVDVVSQLSRILNDTNELVRTFKNAHDLASAANIDDYSVRLYGTSVDRRYDPPVPGSLGAIVSGPDDRSTKYDIIVQSKAGHARRRSNLHRIYMPLQYPLLFPFGEVGWSSSMRLVGRNGSESGSLTAAMFYGSQFHDRSGRVSLILMAGRLLQQYLVDAYIVIEHSRLEYIRGNQSKLRKDFVAGIYDAIARGDTDGRSVGQRTFLPSSFVGGPRYMYQHYQDALAICRVHGNPQYFITFTCNVNWPEITRYMETRQLGGPENRPDIIARVFHLKVREFIAFLKDDRTFGDVSAYLYTIEFQKRGLPHCHTLLWVTAAHKIVAPADVDKYITAELPDQIAQPLLYSIVTKCMIHGPCGPFNPKSPCMRNGKCKFSFPRPFNPTTSFDVDGYARYKRGSSAYHDLDNGIRIHNDFVVPYNIRLSCRFMAHINVEYCGWNMMIKYLFKYISKGADRVSFVVQKTGTPTSLGRFQGASEVDEVQKFVDGRYICPHEAAWRIFKFPIHERHPAVQILAVHLPNMQPSTFTDTTSLTNLVNSPTFGISTLTGWFASNGSAAAGRHLTYVDYPSLYWWNTSLKAWVRRVSASFGTIGRLIYVPPTSGELFYLRMLLCHQKGCTSFLNLRTVAGREFPTFYETCEAMGLIGDDQEWLAAFNEASLWATSSQLRTLFSNLLVYCDVTKPLFLWEEGWRRMTDDIARVIMIHGPSSSTVVHEDILKEQLLLQLQILFDSASPPKKLADFGLPQPGPSVASVFGDRLLSEESCYDRPLLAKQHALMLSQLNADQLSVYNTVKDDDFNGKQSLLFVYGHGGTGKTFLWSTILAYFRSIGKIALAVAGSGIASLLLPSGRTAHSRFQIPLKVFSQTMCTIKKRTQLSRLLCETRLIIWDEATMTDRRCFECVDRSFRDILEKPDLPFGGISLLLGGDFRQTLPVKPKKSMADVIGSTLPNSYLWCLFRIYMLHQNMRLSSMSPQTIRFASWLLRVGNGDIGTTVDDDTPDKKLINIPEQLLIHECDQPLQQLIDFVYPVQLLQHPTPSNLSDRAIVCPKNATTQDINDRILNMTQGISKTYHSLDAVQPRGHRHLDLDLLYPSDYLNQLKFSGFPVSNLELKVDTPIILLRNINVREGLCNGTRLIVTRLLTHLIEADVITGNSIGTKVYIPRITLVHDGDDIPFLFTRKQFPVRICYAMTINKSQGQSLKKVGIYLPHPVFGHGQLYVALSRATSIDSVKMLILDDGAHTLKTTHNIVCRELLHSIESTQVT